MPGRCLHAAEGDQLCSRVYSLADVIGLQATVVGAALALAACAIVGMARFQGFRPLDEALEDETGRGPDLMIDPPPSIAAAD